jgi:DNA recombination protein RmuC
MPGDTAPPALFSTSVWFALSLLLAVLAALGGAWFGALRARERERGVHGAELQRLRETEQRGQLELATATERLRGSESEVADLRRQLDALRTQATTWRDALDAATDERARLDERAARVPRLESDLATAQALAAALRSELGEVQARAEAERANAAEQLRLLQDARTGLADQFKALAAEILEDKSRRFTEQNQTQLGELLTPLRQRLTEFQTKVETLYDAEGKERSVLAEQVRSLAALNRTLSDDAKNLTLALKGSAKTQGNWGELILERVLEGAGLRRGIEYQVQDSHVREDGSRAVLDVVLNLPDERQLVIDAKVSLVAYERFAIADNDDERAMALRAHLESLRSHVRGLSERKYQDLPGVKTLDCVLAFVPIEPAFIAAVTHDAALFQDAWDRNVLLVSPSTLMFVLRTVAYLWRQEAQSRNAQDIAKRGAELYDKLSGFVADLEAVGRQLDLARKSHADALAKFATGKGNAIRQAEMLRELGVKPSKRLPAEMLERAIEGTQASD